MQQQIIKLKKNDIAILDKDNRLVFLINAKVYKDDCILYKNYRAEVGAKNIIVNINKKEVTR